MKEGGFEMSSSVSIQCLGKRFGNRWVLKNISLNVSLGETLVISGGNGAGKTTLIKLIAGLLPPSQGSVTVDGRMGWMGHESQLYDLLTVREQMHLFATLFGKKKNGSIPLLEKMGLAESLNVRARELSHGMKKRLSFAKLLLGEPNVILLDEPHAGLDRHGKMLIHDLMTQWKEEKKTVIVASHDHELVDALATNKLDLQKS